jgi:hypothetical protein
VISLFHVVNYQTTDDALRAMFDTAGAHLKTGGVFLFDFWYGPAVLAEMPEVRVKRLQDADISVTRIAEPELLPNENVVNVNYTLFIETVKTGTTQRVNETHRMRYLFLPELRSLHDGVFDERGTHEWLTSEPVSERTWSGFQVLTRR